MNISCLRSELPGLLGVLLLKKVDQFCVSNVVLDFSGHFLTSFRHQIYSQHFLIGPSPGQCSFQLSLQTKKRRSGYMERGVGERLKSTHYMIL